MRQPDSRTTGQAGVSSLILMAARFDHLVVSVDDLDGGSSRWRELGLAVEPGGRHPGGTVNALVRGPGSAYVELISVEPGATSGWAERVRGTRGPLGFVLAVDDIDAARDALICEGFTPAEPVAGSRTTPAGHIIRWRFCQVGEQPFDPHLPSLIEWIDAMPSGPADGPVLESISVEVPDRDRLATMLRVLGFSEPPTATPGITFTDGEVSIWLPATGAEMEEWERQEDGSRAYLRWGEAADEDEEARVGPTSVSLGVSSGLTSWQDIDGLSLTTHPDVRSHVGHVLLPAVERHFDGRAADLAHWPDPHPGRAPLEEEYSRCLDPAKYRILGARVNAWAQALADAGVAETVVHASGLDLVPRRRDALSLTVTLEGFEGLTDNLVQLSVGETVLTRLPDCGCDACDDGSDQLLRALDETILHVLDGGVLQVSGPQGRVVTTTLDGWSASGRFDRDEPDRWVADARTGQSRHEVLEGAAWL